MWRRIGKALIIFAFFTATGLLLFSYRYLEYLANRRNVPPIVPFLDEVVTGSWLGALLFPLIARFARRYPVNSSNWFTRLPLHAGALFAYSGLHTSLIWAARSLLYPLLGFDHYDYGVIRVRYPMELSLDTIVYSVIVTFLWLLDRHVRALQLESKLALAKLENLRLQLQPHFLFNALNTISSVVYEDPRKADAMLARLAAMLRATLSDSDKQVVPLDQEIETLELYLQIMRLRFEDKLRVDVCVAPEVLKALTPHLLLQPLVENAIRYGKDPASHAVAIRITAERDGRETRVQVRDQGPGLPKSGIHAGTGITNTAERLEQLYGPRQKLTLENGEHGGAVVTVTFPYQT